MRLTGRMDAENALKFEGECESWLAQGIANLVVDAGELAYVSSMGLRSCMTGGKKLQDGGGKLRVCCLAGLVKQVFEITRLDTLFPMHDSVEAALAER